jgi:hypothetical protein
MFLHHTTAPSPSFRHASAEEGTRQLSGIRLMGGRGGDGCYAGGQRRQKIGTVVVYVKMRPGPVQNLDGMSGHAVQILESGQPCTSIWTKSEPNLELGKYLLDQFWQPPNVDNANRR